MPEILKGSLGPEQQFKKYLSEGKFMIQKSKSLNKFFFHPRVAFPGSGERDLEWLEASGHGVIHEGPRMMARVEGIDPDKVEIGQKVKARISSLKGEPAIIFDVM